MNERIKQLAKPYIMYERFSRYGESTEEEYYDFLPEELEQFVQSIVRECGEIAYKTYWNNPLEVRGVHFKEAMYKQFGVK
jgi:hypothetical protein